MARGGCVVVGYDGDGAAATLRRAADLADRLGAPLEVLHAMPAPMLDASQAAPGVPGRYPAAWPVVDSRAAEESRVELERTMTGEIAQQLTGRSTPWACHVEYGVPSTLLAEHADREEAELVVVGARSPGLGAAFDRMMGGSTVRELEHQVDHPAERDDARGGRWALVIVPAGPEPAR